MVTAGGPEPFDFIGLGGAETGPPPNYRIIGTVVRQPEEGEKSLQIRLFIRGDHIMFGDAPVMDVNMLGADEFVHSGDEESRAVIAAGIEAAYNRLAGADPRRGVTDVSAPESDSLTVGSDSITLSALHTRIQVDFQTNELRPYGEAMNRRIMYTYVGASELDVRELDAAIAELNDGPLRTKDVLAAAQKMRLALFGAAETQVGETPTEGASMEELVIFIRDREAELVGKERLLTAALARAATAERLLVLKQREVDDLRARRPGGPTVPTTPTTPTTTGAELTEARSKVQALSRDLRALKSRARRDSSLRGEVTAMEAELAAAMREVDRLLASPGGSPAPAPVPSTPTTEVELTAARDRAQALSRQLSALKARAKRDPSLKGDVHAMEAALTAAMREVDRLMG